MPFRKRTKVSATRALVRDDAQVKVSVDFFWVRMSSTVVPSYEISGKYLFYSPDAEQLASIAENEIVNHGFHRAKWSREPMESSGDYVLCLYYFDKSRGAELAQRARSEYGWVCEPDSRLRWETPPGMKTRVRFRWWKADADTYDGLYSEKFLELVPTRLQAIFTAPKPKKVPPKRRAATRKRTTKK